MLLKIVNVYLYASTNKDSEAAKVWLETHNIPYTLLCYRDEAQHPMVFEALNSWFNTTLDSFPVVVYDEIHDDMPSVKAYIDGWEALRHSNLAELYQLG